MFGGVVSDCWIAILAGGAAFLTFSFVQRFIQIKFFSEFVASAVVITIAVTFTKLGIATNQNIITISSVMPLVPGILICNAIRDLMAGELLAGMSRGVEAALTSFAIGAGVAIVLLIFKKGCLCMLFYLFHFVISFISTVLFLLYLTLLNDFYLLVDLSAP